MSDQTTTHEPKLKEKWWKRTWVVGVAAGVLGLGIGAAGAGADPKESSEFKAQASELKDVRSELSDIRAELSPALAAVAKTDDREEALDKRESKLDDREASIRQDSAAVKKREKAVGIVETEIKSNTISGDGIFKVGEDIKAGTYKTTGTSGCYYAILASTDTSDIVDNNNLDGPGFLTVRDGQYLELSRCDDWVRQ